MIFTSKKCLLLQLLAITVCCSGAPLGKRDRIIERESLQRTLGESTENATPNEPIKILRSTDRDVIIQVRRPPFKQSREVGGREEVDDLQYSDVSMYNKHKKSKPTSDEGQGRLTDGKVGEDRISRLSMHRLPSTAEEFRSDEVKIEDKIVHDLEEKENEWLFEEQNDQEMPKPSNFESQIRPNAGDISEKYVNDEDHSFKTSNKNTRLKDLDIELSDEENNKENTEFIDINSFEDKWNSQENGSQTSKDGKNKRELNSGGFKMPEIKSLRERIIDLRKKSNPFKAKSPVDGLLKNTPFDLIRSKNTEALTKHTPKLLPNSFKSISFKRNDILKTNKQVPRSTTEAYISKLDDRGYSSLLDHQEPLTKKVVHTRSSPSFDSLQDLKRKIKKERELSSLVPSKPALLGRELAEVSRGPAYDPPPPPDGQYYTGQRPIIVIPTEDPVLQAERAHTALQRMILFVNAMGKFDYYISNAARNFVDLMTSHTHDYDQTVRRRHADNEGCESKKKEDDDDDDEEEEDDKGGFVRIRASKSRRRNNIERSGEEQTNLRLRDSGNKW